MGKDFAQIKLDEALAIHLQYNHYPPVSLSMIGACKQAINYCNKGLYDHNVRLPNGVLITAWEIVEDNHLDEWLTGEGE